MLAVVRQMAAMCVMGLLCWQLPGCGEMGATDGKLTMGRADGHGFIYKKNARGRGYAVFVPVKYVATKKYPMIVFLHGLGEGGNDPSRPVVVGIGPMVAQSVAQYGDFGFIVLFPQSETGNWDDPLDYKDVFEEIAATCTEYAVDKNRISLTGISNGGYGAYAVAAAQPAMFSALAPMETARSASRYAPRLVAMNIWAFDNRDDPLGCFATSTETLGAIRTAGGNPRQTVLDRNSHDCWSEAYRDAEFMRWLRDSLRGMSYN